MILDRWTGDDIEGVLRRLWASRTNNKSSDIWSMPKTQREELWLEWLGAVEDQTYIDETIELMLRLRCRNIRQRYLGNLSDAAAVETTEKLLVACTASYAMTELEFLQSLHIKLVHLDEATMIQKCGEWYKCGE